jgi:hypothetical protein
MARVWASKHVPGEAGVPRFSRPLQERLPWTAIRTPRRKSTASCDALSLHADEISSSRRRRYRQNLPPKG